MAKKKQDAFYFEKFCEAIEYSLKAAELLNDVMENYSRELLKSKLDEMHSLEHHGDEVKHEVVEVLNKAFITPIEREDIMLMLQNIDDLTDRIEDVYLRLYCNNIKEMRPDAVEVSETLVKACSTAKKMMDEFQDYKHSKKLGEHIVEINTLEGEADQQYIDSLHRLHTTGLDALTVIEYRDVYIYLERCMDTCEHLADSVTAVVTKNS